MGSRIASRVCGLLLLVAGASCNSSTISGKGTGGCATTCSTSDATCGSRGCSDAGECVYPSAGTACPGTSCSDGALSQMACDGAGACRPEGLGTACPGNYACAIDGSCGNSCSSTAYCATGFVCNAGRCVKPIEVGSCTENDDCQSEICGAAGTGNCCRASCATDDAACGPTDCDDGGACLYAAASMVCGPAQQSCTGSTQANPSHCDGLGHCENGTTSCAPFICGINACKTSCASNADCVAGAACDAATTTCCAGPASGDVLAVDSVLGDDAAPCCGSLGALPCRTLTRAMGLIEGAAATRITLLAKVNGAASGNWSPEGEVYPIELGWGVELKAPGIFFPGPDDAGNSAPAIFELTGDAGAEAASIVGTSVSPVGIGMGQAGNQLVVGTAIADGPGSTLYLANVNVNGSNSATSIAIYANGSTLILGQDRSGAVTGPIQIGNDFANPQPIGGTGIECNGCTLSDVPTGGSSSLVIFGQTQADIVSYGPSSISLKSAPILGIAPTSVGFNTCPSKPDHSGIVLYGTMTMTLDQATIQCMSSFGIDVNDDGDRGMPSVTVNKTTIQNTALGLGVIAGSVVMSNSVIRYNGAGIAQGDLVFQNGAVDLSGGEVGGRNTVACSNSIESGGGSSGISIWNGGINALNASNVDWDTPGPDLFSCDYNLTTCTCQIAACTDAPGADGMDAVVYSTATITTTGNGLSPLSCAVAPPSN